MVPAVLQEGTTKYSKLLATYVGKRYLTKAAIIEDGRQELGKATFLSMGLYMIISYKYSHSWMPDCFNINYSYLQKEFRDCMENNVH